jgi:hypothetical protein
VSDRIAVVIPLSDIKPSAAPMLDAPPEGSDSARYRVRQGHLITPDGDRVWRVAGWREGNLYCQPIKDFLERRTHFAKCIPDDVKRFSRLAVVNQQPERIERFMADYLAANHGVGLQKQRFGLSVGPGGFCDLVGKKIYAYWCGSGTAEHVVQDCDNFMRAVLVKDQEGRRFWVDQWEITASWHFAYDVPPARVQPQPAVGQYLYRLYNRAGSLLYVGITDNVFRRWKEHSRDKPWWTEVHKFTQDWYPDRASVEAAERHAITTERPSYNVIGARSLAIRGSD